MNNCSLADFKNFTRGQAPRLENLKLIRHCQCIQVSITIMPIYVYSSIFKQTQLTSKNIENYKILQ